jgi:hypothetical protein
MGTEVISMAGYRGRAVLPGTVVWLVVLLADIVWLMSSLMS